MASSQPPPQQQPPQQPPSTASCWSNIVEQTPPKPAVNSAATTAKLIEPCNSSKGVAIAVIDANAVIQGGEKLHTLADKFVSVAEVNAEIRDPTSRHRMSFLPFDIQSLEPSPESLKKVISFARATGDLQTLSDVDLKLIALTHTLEVQFHGTTHLRDTPPPIHVVNVRRLPEKDLPGWGDNVPNLAEWEALEGLAESGLNSDSKILPLKDLNLNVLAADSDRSSVHDGSVGNGSEVSLVDDKGVDEVSRKQKRYLPIKRKVKIDGKKMVADSVDASQGQFDDDAGDFRPAFSRSTHRRFLRRQARRELYGASLKDDDEEQEPIENECNDLASEEAHVNGANGSEDVSVILEQMRLEDQQSVELKDIDINDAHLGDEGEGNDVNNEAADNLENGSVNTSLMEDAESEQSWMLRSLSELSVACVTGDYAMQNVILQMGLRLLAPGGMQIRELHRWVLKCHACNHVTAEVGRILCPKCGNGGTLRKVAVTVDENGVVLAARKPRISLRGTKLISLPNSTLEDLVVMYLSDEIKKASKTTEEWRKDIEIIVAFSRLLQQKNDQSGDDSRGVVTGASGGPMLEDGERRRHVGSGRNSERDVKAHFKDLSEKDAAEKYDAAREAKLKDTKINKDSKRCKVSKELEDEIRLHHELEAKERKLDESLAYYRRRLDEAKQRRLAAQHRQNNLPVCNGALISRVVDGLSKLCRLKKAVKHDISQAPQTMPSVSNSRHVRRSQNLFGRGLQNEHGEFNCFLNVIIQSLWNLKRFREEFLKRSGSKHAHAGDHCIVCSLSNILSALSRASEDAKGEPVNPSIIRKALSKLDLQPNLFQVGQMNDASEVLDVIFKSLHQSFTSDLGGSGGDFPESSGTDSWDCSSPSCIVHRLFGMDIFQQMICCGCGLESRQLKYTSFFHHVNVSTLRTLKDVDKERSFDELLNLVQTNQRLVCDLQSGGCGKLNHINHTLSNPPQVFTAVLGWQNMCESLSDIKATLAVLSTEIDISVLYHGSDAHNPHRLAVVVCYGGRHYCCFAYNVDLDKWVMYDDKNVKVIGAWEDVLFNCEQRHLQPQILFYAAAD